MFDAGIGGKGEYLGLAWYGDCEVLMQSCSNVYITGEFASFFYTAFDAGVWGILRG